MRVVRERDLSDRCFENYEHIIDALCRAWNRLTVETGRIASQCFRRRAIIEQSFYVIGMSLPKNHHQMPMEVGYWFDFWCFYGLPRR